MKHKSIILIFFLCFCLSASIAFADELSHDIIPVQDDNSSTTPVVVDITQLLVPVATDPDVEDIEKVEIVEPTLIKAESTRSAITPSDTNGFKAVMLTIIGDYEMTVTDYTYQNNSNYYSHSISIERDWTWIISACMLGLITYCTFRAVGGCLCRV